MFYFETKQTFKAFAEGLGHMLQGL